MTEYSAVFEIDSKTDAYAVERLMESLYDALREETRTLRDDANDTSAMLEQFEAIREAARDPSPGTLTIRYESSDGDFDDR